MFTDFPKMKRAKQAMQRSARWVLCVLAIRPLPASR